MPSVKIAALAVAAIENMLAENYARGLRLAEIALDAQPDLILLPETFAAGYGGTDLAPYAEDLDSPHLRGFAELSARGDCLVVLGFLQATGGRPKNSVVVYDRGELLGVHSKTAMWADDVMPFRDERSLLTPGEELVSFPSRVGHFGVLICYENRFPEKWDELAARCDFLLSPYNCQGDPSFINRVESPRTGLPSAWADRTGTVYLGDHWEPNLGTAGLIDGAGNILACSTPGVETIIVGELSWD